MPECALRGIQAIFQAQDVMYTPFKGWQRQSKGVWRDQRPACHVSSGDQQEPALRHRLHSCVQELCGRAIRIQVHCLIAVWILRSQPKLQRAAVSPCMQALQGQAMRWMMQMSLVSASISVRTT